MQLFVGLGNPGAKYANTRHNIGFMALDAIADHGGFGPWRTKFQGQLSEGVIGGEKTLLLKPETFMNLSGQSVGEAMRFYKLDPTDVTVFHDELDIAPSKVKLKTGGGHAGHNGLRSLHAHIGEAYHRVRLGIGHPGDKRLVSHFVLQDFSKADQAWLAPLLDGIGRGFDHLARGRGDRFMNAVALNRPKPEKKPRPNTDTAPLREAIEPEKTEAEPEKSPLQRLMDRFS